MNQPPTLKSSTFKPSTFAFNLQLSTFNFQRFFNLKLSTGLQPSTFNCIFAFMKPVYIIDTIRTAVGRYGGGLSNIRPDDLLAEVIKALLKRNENINVHAI